MRRRTVLLGLGSALATSPAAAAEPDTLELSYADETKRDAIILRYSPVPNQAQPDRVWSKAMFGSSALLEIERRSAVQGRKEMSWSPAQWLLRVTNAVFPGGGTHDLRFVFERAQLSPAGSFGPWMVRLETARWPSAQDRARVFGDKDRRGAIHLHGFMVKEERLEAQLPVAVAGLALAGWFGERIQTNEGLVFGIDSWLTWHVAAPSRQLFMLNVPLGFSGLEVRRTFGDGSTPVPAKASPAELPRLFADAAPRQARNPDGSGPLETGLYAEAKEPFDLPSLGEKANTFEFASRFVGREAVSATIAIPDLRHARAGLRHWGDPRFTVAGLQLQKPAKNTGELATLATLTLDSRNQGYKARSHVFCLAAVEITRQMRADRRVVTQAVLRPVGKEHVIATRFGPLEVRAAPPVPERTGLAARVPPIRILALDDARDDRTGQERRDLVEFEAVLSMLSAGVRLPDHATGDPDSRLAAGQHVARLEFDDAECRFVLPLLGGRAHPVSADAWVPLGAGPGAASVDDAFLDLGRARLTVLRPTDLLSLGFRFSGLLLELPPLDAGRRTRVLPNRGAPVCRASSPAPPVRDERPILVVEFPPQHVAERAYLSPQPATADLPGLNLTLANEGQRDALKLLRGEKPSGSRTEQNQARLSRIKARQTLRGEPKLLPAASEAFAAEFEQRAALRKASHLPTRLPREQQIYAGPEFLDPDARRLARQVLRDQAAAPGREPIARFDLSNSDLKKVLAPFGIEPQKGVSPFDAWLEEHRLKSDEVELAKDRSNRDYAVFRSRFAKEFGERPLKPWNPPALSVYRGWEWLNAIRAEFPAVAQWVAGYEATFGGVEPIAPVAEARLSGPSRLAFRINCDDFQAERSGGGFDFSLEALTNWGSMDLAVVRRAEKLFDSGRGPAPPRWARTAVLDEGAILAFQGIGQSDHIAVEYDRAERLGSVRPARTLPPSRTTAKRRLAQVTEAARAGPDTFQTAIELPFRLMLSPAQDATWLTPNASIRKKVFGRPTRELPDQVNLFQELWSATLAGNGTEAGVRAIWSPDFRPEALLSTDAPGAPPYGPYASWSLPRAVGVRAPPLIDVPPFRASLDANDRHQMVILSSVHGLPVLGRRNAEGAIVPEGSQFEPPDGFRLDDLVLDPSPSGGKERDFSAIYRPQPLNVTELALTALGGNLDHDTGFTPPASARLRAGPGRATAVNLFDALSVERWRNRTVLGRDVLVEVVYKGFLFPIGHKATLVKLTERRFEQVTPDGGPVAVLIQRMFLRVGQPQKPFPAYDHPNMARRWPAERVTMLTRRSPDIVDPNDDEGAKPRLDVPGGDATGLIFWPRTSRRNGTEVQFEMLIDDEAASGSMPLLFVDNAAAHDVQTMRALADYYNNTGELAPMRRLPRNGQAVRMAPAQKPGDTSFTTEWWDLRAEGRESGIAASASPSAFVLDNRKYEIDPFMEGLDQPGFYPVVNTARCRLTQVERFTGRPSVWAEVAYDGFYALNGFGVAATEGGLAPANEVFLQLVKGADGDAPVAMRMAGSDRAGGIAQPDLDVVGISRSIGPIGRAEAVTQGNRSVTKTRVTLGDAPATEPDGSMKLTSLAELTSDPKPEACFPPEATVMGLVRLADVATFTGKLADQPRLKEVTEFGAAGVQGKASEARSYITQSVLQPIATVLADLEVRWRAVAGVTFKDLSLSAAYPQIGKSLDALISSVDNSLNRTANDGAFFASLALIYEAGRSFVAVIEAILRDPLASISDAQLQAFRSVLADIEAVVKLVRALPDGLKAIAGAVRLQLIGMLVNLKGWRRLMFLLPAPGPELPADLVQRFEEISEQALDQALDLTLAAGESFDLRRLPEHFAAKLLALPEDDPALKAALDDARALIVAEAGDAFRLLVTPYAQLVVEYFNLLSLRAKAVEQDIAKGLDKGVEALFAAAADVVSVSAALLAPASVLNGVADLCGVLRAQVVPAFTGLIGALLPAAVAVDPRCAILLRRFAELGAPADLPPPPPWTAPGQDTAVNPGEACDAVLYLVDAIARVERAAASASVTSTPLAALRQKLAQSGVRLAAALTRIQRTLERGITGPPSTGCPGLPVALVSAVTALLSAREEAFKALNDVVTDLVKVPAALATTVTAGSPADVAQAAAVAIGRVREAGVVLLRFMRAASLLAGVLQTSDGDGEASGRATELTNAIAALRALALLLTPEAAAEVNEVLTKLEALKIDLEAQSRTVVGQFRATIPPVLDAAVAETSAALNALAAFQATFEADLRNAVEKRASDLVLRLSLSAEDVLGPAATKVTQLLEPLIGRLAVVSAGVVEQRDRLAQSVTGDGAAGGTSLAAALLRAVRAKVGGELFKVPLGTEQQRLACQAIGGTTCDRLDYEARLARRAADSLAAGGTAGLAGAAEPLDTLRRFWVASGPALLVLVRQFATIDAEFARTLVLSAIDLKAVRREVETRIRGLIPARIVLPYDLDTELGEWPKGKPLFKPVPGTRLRLHAETVIHLPIDQSSPPKPPDYQVTGEIGPFAIRLLGEQFDVATLHFHGLSFKAGSGVSPDFKVRFKAVAMGKQAEFLKPLQDYLSPKGSGFYISFLEDRPGIEAGYGINLGVIGVGALSFSNVILNAAVRLSFDGSPALFVVSIGRADAPFLISSTIFGGGGYLALLADSAKFVGFEASFDYGGVAAFGFGPLQGVGRLTMGVYLRKVGPYTSLGATFFAGGAAHIACFGFSTALMVRMIQDEGGPMCGEASYTFSFSIGIDDIDFEVRVKKNEGTNMGERSAAAVPPGQPRVMLAQAPSAVMTDAQPAPTYPAMACPARVPASLSVIGTTQRQDWRAYRKYFDVGLQPAKRPRRAS